MGEAKLNCEAKYLVTEQGARLVRNKTVSERMANAGRWSLGVFGGLVGMTVLVGGVLNSASVGAVETTTSANASVNVSAACTLSGGNNNFTATVANGTTVETSDTTTFGNTNNIKATCNDPNGLAIYAVGYSGNTVGANSMIASIGSDYNIATGTSGSNSYWAMKLAPVSGTYTPIISGSSSDPTKQAGDTDYSSYAAVPSAYTKVAYYTANTDLGSSASGASITPTYKISISSVQPAGTYTGKVKYTLIHPNTSSKELTLYDMVASMSKGKQGAIDLQQTIVTPSEETPVSTNSGVYEYNADEFGVSSDAANTSKIYYYRGVLDSYGSTGSYYGSNGLADAYPNYVVLSAASDKSGLTTTDTCWRIVRTTGSGGVKMIYNGKWTGTTCANTGSLTRIGSSAYNGTSSATSKRIALLGYTYNPTYGDNNVSVVTSTSLIFGDSSDYSNNTANSTIKGNIDNWFSDTLSDYETILEPSAGYCNDRSTYSDKTIVNPLNSMRPTNAGKVFFGAYGRYNNGKPSLACPRGAVDIYTTQAGLNGNKQLDYPIAALTVDEKLFINGANACARCFSTSGIITWTMSPGINDSGGAKAFIWANTGGLNVYVIHTGSYTVRPAISLTPGTTIDGGSGIATDPWIVNPPAS